MAKVGRMVKEASVEELSARFAERPNVFVTSVNRLPAADADTFRRQLFAFQARLVVVKRRLGQRAIERLKLSGLTDLLDGTVGLVFSGEDPLVTAKLIVDFRKAHEEQLTLRGAVIDGQLLEAARVEELAQLPPRPVLLTQVIFTIESPMTDLIMTLERLIGDVAWLVEQAVAKRPAEPPKPLPAAPTPASSGAAQAGAQDPATQPAQGAEASAGGPPPQPTQAPPAQEPPSHQSGTPPPKAEESPPEEEATS